MFQPLFPWLPTPWPGAGPGNQLFQKAQRLVGRPVGVSLRNGQGVSGVLCQVNRNEIVLMQYLYQQQFASFRYEFQQIRDILSFPPCSGHGGSWWG